jgi:Zn-dependent metalloprotease
MSCTSHHKKGLLSQSLKKFERKQLLKAVSDFTFKPNVSEFDYIKPADRTDPALMFKPRNETSVLVAVDTPYNGRVNLPLTGGDQLVSNIYFEGVAVQIAVYDGQNISESEFTSKYFSSNSSISSFISSVNDGSFPYSTTRVDPAAANAFFCILSYYEMMYTVFGRVGLADQSHVLASVANIKFTNAFWTGFCMCFGNAGDSGGKVKPLTAMDVCGHELSHGLQTFTTEFEYQGESGALNESIADVFGTFLEFYVNSPIDVPDWTVGEQFDFIIRDLSNPKSKRQPVVLGGEYWVNSSSEEDNGGVHTNSGVSNYLCYLSSVGIKQMTTEDGRVFNAVAPPLISDTGVAFALKDYVRVVLDVLVSRSLSTTCSLSDFACAVVKASTSRFGPEVGTYVNTCAQVGKLCKSPTKPPPQEPVPQFPHFPFPFPNFPQFPFPNFPQFPFPQFPFPQFPMSSQGFSPSHFY